MSKDCCNQSVYRGGNKGLYVLLSRTQAGPGRTVKHEQEEISRNHVQAFILGSVHNISCPLVCSPNFLSVHRQMLSLGVGSTAESGSFKRSTRSRPCEMGYRQLSLEELATCLAIFMCTLRQLYLHDWDVTQPINEHKIHQTHYQNLEV